MTRLVRFHYKGGISADELLDSVLNHCSVHLQDGLVRQILEVIPGPIRERLQVRVAALKSEGYTWFPIYLGPPPLSRSEFQTRLIAACREIEELNVA